MVHLSSHRSNSEYLARFGTSDRIVGTEAVAPLDHTLRQSERCVASIPDICRDITEWDIETRSRYWPSSTVDHYLEELSASQARIWTIEGYIIDDASDDETVDVGLCPVS